MAHAVAGTEGRRCECGPGHSESQSKVIIDINSVLVSVNQPSFAFFGSISGVYARLDAYEYNRFCLYFVRILAT